MGAPNAPKPKAEACVDPNLDGVGAPNAPESELAGPETAAGAVGVVVPNL